MGFDWHELSHTCSHPRANSFNLGATFKDFNIFHEFNYFVSLLAMISLGHNCAALRAAEDSAYSVENLVTFTIDLTIGCSRNWDNRQSRQSGECAIGPALQAIHWHQLPSTG